MSNLSQQLSLEKLVFSEFLTRFGHAPEIFRAPGRINLIGDHTDYHQGFVLPAAVDVYITLAIQVSSSSQNRIYSLDFNSYAEFEFSQLSLETIDNQWLKYVYGMLSWIHAIDTDFPSIDLVIGGNIPVGGGMSSSAALCNALGIAFARVAQLTIEPQQIIFAAQATEHRFAGVNCGIMDQFASMFGKDQQAIFLDCQTLTHEYVYLDLRKHCFVLFDTAVKHSLAESEYNQRQIECKQALDSIRADYPQIQSLRDVNKELLYHFQSRLPELNFNRCLFVIEENERVLQSVELLRGAKFEEFGQMMTDSHQGLRFKYEVSCEELDFLVETCVPLSGTYGARMMGGGFGGCTINFLERNQKQQIIQSCKNAFQAKYQRELKVYEVEIVDGARMFID